MLQSLRLFLIICALSVLPAGHVLAQQAPVAAAEAELHDDAHDAEEGGGMIPQLDPRFYASQIFWLIVSGAILYILMSRVALPRVAQMVDLRDNLVRQNLEQAYRLKQEAENLQIAYTRSLHDADNRARTLIEKTLNDLKDGHKADLAAGAERINDQIKTTEHYLRGEKDALLDELSLIVERLSGVVVKELVKGKAS